jgi:hypothetical protein
MKNYTITLNDRQAGIMQLALETYARLGMYQIDAALRALPISSNDFIDYEDEKKIKMVLNPHCQKWLVESKNKRSEHHDVAWDLQTVIRHRIAWDVAKKRGEVREDGRRDWNKQLAAWYDEPSQHSLEPLAKIEVTA